MLLAVRLVKVTFNFLCFLSVEEVTYNVFLNKYDTALSKMSIFETLRMSAEIKRSKLDKSFQKSSPISQFYIW